MPFNVLRVRVLNEICLFTILVAWRLGGESSLPPRETRGGRTHRDRMQLHGKTACMICPNMLFFGAPEATYSPLAVSCTRHIPQ